MLTENGQGLVEYSLILLLVALALILVLSIFGTEPGETRKYREDQYNCPYSFLRNSKYS